MGNSVRIRDDNKDMWEEKGEIIMAEANGFSQFRVGDL